MTTWQEKRQARFEAWLNPAGMEFVSPAAKAEYQSKVQRTIDAIELKKTPDRIPLYPNHTFMPMYLEGKYPLDAMQDVKGAIAAFEKFMDEYYYDSVQPIALINPKEPMEMLGYELYKWPGKGGVPETSVYRYVEHDWMEGTEYKALANDPSNFWLRTYIPRFCTSLSAFTKLPTATDFIELPNFIGFVSAFGDPDLQKSLKTLMEAGAKAREWIGEVGAFIHRSATKGHPTCSGGFTKAPFDTLTDTLRSMKSAMLDLRRHPDGILEAVDALVPLASKMAIDAIDQSGNPLVFIPLHKGADGFMSSAQFEKFYWPSLKKVMDNIIEAGGVPLPFAEGGYSQRMDCMKDMPRGAVAWIIDRTDMLELKKRVGDHCCLIGNVPGSMFHSGTPADIEKYCRNLIDNVGPGGGFIMASGTVLDEVRPEMVRAMIDTTLKYGQY